MNSYRVKGGKTTLRGDVTTPPSKSQTLRSILFGTLAHGKSVIRNYLSSSDTQAMIEACRLFGASFEVSNDQMEIHGVNGKISSTEDVIYAGNSGILLRFCSAVGALGHHPVVITGDHSIRHHRPMKALLNGLSQLGVLALSMRGDGYAPVIIQGPIKSGKASISGEDSQPVSALLIAAAFAQGPIELEVQNPGEKPWVALTLGWLERLKIPYHSPSFESYVLPGNAHCHGFEYHVSGDFSSAVFPIAAALITNSELTIHNIDMMDAQGDKEVIAVFQRMGAQFEIDSHKKILHVKKGGLHGTVIDVNNFIDAITILAVVGCFAEGETSIINGAVARQKECDRIHCITTELQKMGADIQETAEGLSVKKSALKGAPLHSYHDHRMAMSLVVAALGAEGETTISSVNCVSKTFPTFAHDLNKLGTCITDGK